MELKTLFNPTEQFLIEIVNNNIDINRGNFRRIVVDSSIVSPNSTDIPTEMDKGELLTSFETEIIKDLTDCGFHNLVIGDNTYIVQKISDEYQEVKIDLPNGINKVIDGSDKSAVGRISGWTKSFNSFEEIFGNELRDEFEEFITANRGSKLSFLQLILVFGAYNRLLFNELYSWTEKNNIADSSTVSRYKTKLEENDVIQTEKTMAMRSGRPNQRLIEFDPLYPPENLQEYVDIAEEKLNK